MPELFLKSEHIEETIDKLSKRIHERFPNSGLYRACRNLFDISRETQQTAAWIARPHYSIRITAVITIVGVLILTLFTVCNLQFKWNTWKLMDFIQTSEAAINVVILVSAGIIFLVTFENRQKRKRAIQSINRLRSLAHVIDAHQLTKDPDRTSNLHLETPSSPKKTLTDYELGRYLDYCSEMLSLTSKLGFLYVQNFDDPVANNAVNELESLTNGLARKIWQKIMILKSRNPH